MDRDNSILIIGGGVIGLCCAYFLTKAGKKVTLIDKGPIGHGCSYGNTVLIVPSHCSPLCAPGIVKKGLSALLSGHGPFYLKPQLSFSFWKWLLQFMYHCRSSHENNSIPIISKLLYQSSHLFQQIANQKDADFYYQNSGMLTVYNNLHTFNQSIKKAHQLRNYNVDYKILCQKELLSKYLQLTNKVVGGIYYPQDAVINPYSFSQYLSKKITEFGGKVLTAVEVIKFVKNKVKIQAVITTKGTFLPQQIVLAAGASTPQIARLLKKKLPIQPAKGFSITIHNSDIKLKTSLILEGEKISISTIDNKLRIAGALELGGYNNSHIDYKKVLCILNHASHYFKKPLHIKNNYDIWQGYRACTPNGMPIICKDHQYNNLIIASGHAVLGVSLAPITGKIVHNLILQNNHHLQDIM